MSVWLILSHFRSYINNLREKDPGSNPGPGESFSLELLIYDLSYGYSES
jgi:hypothetical protein